MRETFGIGLFVSAADVFAIVADFVATEPDGPFDGGQCGDLCASCSID